MPISLHYIAFLGYDYAVYGHKATFSGSKPLFWAQGHFNGHKATCTGPRPPFWAQSHFPSHYIAFLGYDYAVSWHKAIFLALPMLFTDAMPSFWVQSHFLSIINAVYGCSPFLGTKPFSFRAQSHWHMAISLALPMLFTGAMPFLTAEAGFPFRAQSHWHFLAISFLGSKPLAHGHFLLLALQMLITDSMPPGTRPFSFLSITNANYGLNAAFILHYIVMRCRYLKTQI